MFYFLLVLVLVILLLWGIKLNKCSRIKNRLNIWTFINYRGFFIGYHWVHANGDSSYSTASVLGYHNPKKVMWYWTVYWSKYKKLYPVLHIKGRGVGIPYLGYFHLLVQEVTC